MRPITKDYTEFCIILAITSVISGEYHIDFYIIETFFLLSAEIAFQDIPFNAIIYENAPAGISLFKAHGCDADGGVCNDNEVNYFLMGDDSATFQIGRANGVITTATGVQKADGGSYKFHVIITAGGLSGYTEVNPQTEILHTFSIGLRKCC